MRTMPSTEHAEFLAMALFLSGVVACSGGVTEDELLQDGGRHHRAERRFGTMAGPVTVHRTLYREVGV